MNYKCIHKEFGVILYRNNGDLLSSLSWAQGSSGDQSVHASTHACTCSSMQNTNEQQVLSTAASIVNTCLLQDIKECNLRKAEMEKIQNH
jgi:hypothetical protein